jgi:DNA-directed RNA polymerase I subunit RPA2
LQPPWIRTSTRVRAHAPNACATDADWVIQRTVNTIFSAGGQLDEGIAEIGTRVFVDGDPYAKDADAGPRNRLSVKIEDVFLDKSVLPPSNKVALQNRNIMPAECRERHATYRGKLRARLRWRVNNEDWREEVCDLGNIPIMLRVRYHRSGCTQQRKC